MPSGGWSALNGGGSTVTLGSAATRVTRTAVPLIVNTHTGVAAGPIDVSTRLVARCASVTTSGVQSAQSPAPAATRSLSAAAAESTSTSTLVPSTQLTFER